MQRKRVNKKHAWMKDLPGTIPALVNRKKLKPVGIPEASMQVAVESYLQIKGIKYFHIPDEAYRAMSYRSPLSIQTKKAMSEAFKGMPDLFIFKKPMFEIGGEQVPIEKALGNSNLLIELKKKNAKAGQAQLRWHRGLNVHVVDTVEEAIKLIDKWSEE